MKKFLAILLATVMTMSLLTACGGQETAPADAAGSEADTAENEADVAEPEADAAENETAATG